MTERDQPEPWLRGTLGELDPVVRAVIHALELAQEDLWKWCYPLSAEQLNERRGDLAPVAFHLRHIARSLDRLLTYAEGGELNEEQWQARSTEFGGTSQKTSSFENSPQPWNRAKAGFGQCRAVISDWFAR